MNIKYARQRRVIAHLYLEMSRQFGQDTYAKGKNRTARLDYAQVIAAILVGHVEDRPFTVTKLSAYLDMPRPNVLRKLEGLKRDGVVKKVGNKFCLVPEAVNHDQWTGPLLSIGREIVRAGKKLERLDDHDNDQT